MDIRQLVAKLDQELPNVKDVDRKSLIVQAEREGEVLFREKFLETSEGLVDHSLTLRVLLPNLAFIEIC